MAFRAICEKGRQLPLKFDKNNWYIYTYIYICITIHEVINNKNIVDSITAVPCNVRFIELARTCGIGIPERLIFFSVDADNTKYKYSHNRQMRNR